MKRWLGIACSSFLLVTLGGCMQNTQPAGISSLYQYDQQFYIVKRGDTLEGVAASFGISPSELAAANQLKSPYQLHQGQHLSL